MVIEMKGAIALVRAGTGGCQNPRGYAQSADEKGY